MLDLGFTNRIEIWIALGTALGALVLILYAIEIKNAVKHLEEWLEEIKFNDWLKKENNNEEEE